MDNFILFLALFLSTCSSSPSPTNSTKKFEAFQLEYRDHHFDVIRLHPRDLDLRFFLADETGDKYRSFKKLKSTLEEKDQTLAFAMNGGMYLKNGSPQGLYIENGKTIKPVDTIQNAYGNFYLQPNGVFYLENQKGKVLTTSQYLQAAIKPDYATQSGPMLLIENEVHPVFVEGSKNLNIRNGVGIDEEERVIFVISKEELNLFDFAMFFKEVLHCKNALYLDGFVSKAYIPTLNRNELGGNFGVIIGAVVD